MLKFGTVTNIDVATAKARVQFADDDLQSFWLPVIQAKTNKDKHFALVDVGEQVACLMDENCEDGVILGAIYSAADSCPAESKNQAMIKFEDGSLFEFNKETQTLTIKCKNVHLIADILQQGAFENTNGITSNAEIIDHTSSMQKMRDIFNPHTHTSAASGSPTSKPNGGM